jgi:tetratricopeptide (TPR) repeat protein
VALAEIFRLKGDEASAAAQEAEALKLDPASVPKAPAAPAPKPAAAAPKAPAAAPAPAPRAAAAPPAVHEDEEEIHLGVEDEEVPILDTAAPAPEPALDLDLDVEGGEEELAGRFIDDEEPAPAAAPAPVADDDLVIDEAGEPLAGLEEAVEEEIRATPSQAAAGDAGLGLGLEEDIDFEAEAPALPPVAPLAARHVETAPAADAPDELAQIFSEVDSYISLGFVDDAKEALRDARRSFPDHPAIDAKLAELGIDLAEEEAPAAAAAADPLEDLALGGALSEEPAASGPMADDTISDDLGLDVPGPEVPATESEGLDLGDELNELFGAQAAVEEAPPAAATDLGDSGLADIFKEFKKGVDKQLGKEDYDTRYNLGIAYKEMGLIDEAIAEFQLAAKDESRTLECSSMLGICFMEKGMPKLAVKWFDRGLKAPGRTEEEYAALRYDLAVAHEAAGEADIALTLFTDLYGQDANFRDVAAKVRELRAARR